MTTNYSAVNRLEMDSVIEENSADYQSKSILVRMRWTRFKKYLLVFAIVGLCVILISIYAIPIRKSIL